MAGGNKNNIQNKAEMEIVREIKEKRCVVIQTPGGPDKESKERESSTLRELKKPIKYLLPDGTEIALGDEKYLAPEILFYPEKIGKEFMGIHEMLISSINKADIDLKKDLYEAIYISGAGSKFPGLATRIFNEIKEKKLDNVKVRRFSFWANRKTNENKKTLDKNNSAERS